MKRNEPLAKEGAISQKEFQDSVQANRAARASVDSAMAALEQAKLNLEWTKIVAPIDGVAGIAKAQVGDLVNTNDELTSMSQLDPIRVYFPIIEQEYLAVMDDIMGALNKHNIDETAQKDVLAILYSLKGEIIRV